MVCENIFNTSKAATMKFSLFHIYFIFCVSAHIGTAISTTHVHTRSDPTLASDAPKLGHDAFP